MARRSAAALVLAGAPLTAILLMLPTALGCGAVAQPSDAEYPALVLPARLPPGSSPPARGATAAGEPAAGGGAPAQAGAPGAGSGGVEAGSATLGAASSAGSGDPTSTPVLGEHGDLPDPQPLATRAQWSFPIVYDRGQIRVGEPEPVCLPRPQSTPRRIGRFAFELWLGRELVDRVRFDFPLLASEEPARGPRRPLRETPRFAPGAHVSVTLRVPASDRAATARIFDRATGDAIAVAWPPRSTDGVTRPHPCPPAGPGAGAAAKPPSATDAGR